MYRDPLPYCPHCGPLDQARKVSAIFDAGTHWAEDPNGVQGVAPSLSLLVLRLAPPTRPRPQPGFEAGWRGLLAFLRLALHRNLVPPRLGASAEVRGAVARAQPALGAHPYDGYP
jgi:hypothetical protein